jgi:hypothetical protein
LNKNQKELTDSLVKTILEFEKLLLADKENLLDYLFKASVVYHFRKVALLLRSKSQDRELCPEEFYQSLSEVRTTESNDPLVILIRLGAILDKQFCERNDFTSHEDNL